MKIIKRSGEEQEFQIDKIRTAITKANQTVEYKNALTLEQINTISEHAAGICQALDRALSVEEIQDIVETRIMQEGAFEVAKKTQKAPYFQADVDLTNKKEKVAIILPSL